MRHLIPALVVTLVGFSTASADPGKPSPFSNKSFGDGNGYKHPDADVGQYFETKPQDSAEAKPHNPAGPTAPREPAKVTPEVKPVAVVPSRPRPRPFAPAPVTADAAGRSASAAVASVSKTGAAPAPAAATAPTGKAPAAASVGGSDDAAAEDARRDYETRLFGAASGSARPGLADPKSQLLPLPPTDPSASVSTGEGMLFVSLELDPQEAGTLRDAVAGLGSAAAFRPDARFQPIPGAGHSVRISGWLPASRLGDAISRPGVKRVEVERGSHPAADSRVTGEYLLTLRVADASRPEESVANAARELMTATGFKLDRVFGFETLPGGGATALVSGTMPVSQLSRALALPGVIKIVSAPLVSPENSSPPVPNRTEGFAKFVMARGLWLVLLTVLLALPTISSAVRKALSVFVPYR